MNQKNISCNLIKFLDEASSDQFDQKSLNKAHNFQNEKVQKNSLVATEAKNVLSGSWFLRC